MTHLIETYGVLFLFLIVGLESAGVWLPGETALVTAAVLASRGHLSITAVIVAAAIGAIVGDNAGYWIGRKWGRRLAYAHPLLARISDRLIPPSERFFRRHGGKAVFLARFFAVVRVTGAWMAGISHMAWWRFLLWNALGGIVWATGIGLLAFFAGEAAAEAFGRYGAFGGAAVVGVGLTVVLLVHFWRRRMLAPEEPQADA